MNYNEIIKKFIDKNKEYFHVFSAWSVSTLLHLSYLYFVILIIFSDLEIIVKLFRIAIGLGGVTLFTNDILPIFTSMNKKDFKKIKYNFKAILKKEHIYSQEKIHNLNEALKKEYFDDLYQKKDRENIISIFFSAITSSIILIITDLQLNPIHICNCNCNGDNNTENNSVEQSAEKYILYIIFFLLFNILPIYLKSIYYNVILPIYWWLTDNNKLYLRDITYVLDELEKEAPLNVSLVDKILGIKLNK